MAGRRLGFDRDAALLIAQRTFWRLGFQSTSISELTRAMGINPPSLYAAFGNKETLFEEAACHYAAGFREDVSRALAASTAGSAIAELLEVTARKLTDPTTPAGCLVLSEPRMDEERSWLRQVVADRIAAGRAAGELAADADPDRIAAFLETVMIGMSARARDGATRVQLDGIAAQTLSIFPGCR